MKIFREYCLPFCSKPVCFRHLNTESTARPVLVAKRSVGLLRVMVAACLFVFGSLHAYSKDSPQDLLLEAEAYYWFGMAENGSPSSFNTAMELLQRVEKELSMYSEADLQTLKNQAVGLRQDIEEQQAMSIDTVYGVFPLSRFLSGTVFANIMELGTYELIDDPDVMAATAGVAAMIQALVEQWVTEPQLDVVFTSNPRRPDLENEALYIFNAESKFFVHTRREVVDALHRKSGSSDLLINDYDTQNFTPQVRNSLFDVFDTDQLLFVQVDEPTQAKESFFVITGRTYQRGQEAPVQILRNMGFSRDRTFWLWPLMIANALLAILVAAVAWAIHRRRPDYHREQVPALFVTVLVAFVFARLLPWSIFPAVRAFLPIPAPETLAIVGWWFPVLAGFLVVVFPLIIIKGVSVKLRSFLPLGGLNSYLGLVGIATGLGASAWWLTPLAMYEGSMEAMLQAVPLVLALGLSSYGLGRSLDRGGKFVWVVGFAVLATLHGPAIMANRPIVLICYGLAVVSSWLFFVWQQGARGEESKLADQTVLDDELSTSWEHPYYQQVTKETENFGVGINLVTIEDADELGQEWLIRNWLGSLASTASVFKISCPAVPTPFGTLNTILDRPLAVEDGKDMDQALELMTSFIPFGSLLSLGGGSGDTSPEQLNEAATQEIFQRFRGYTHAVVVMGVAESMDEPTAKWLAQFCTRRYRQRLDIVLVGNTSPLEQITEFDEPVKNIKVPLIGRDALRDYLLNSKLIPPTVADDVLNALISVDSSLTLLELEDCMDMLQEREVLTRINGEWQIADNTLFRELISQPTTRSAESNLAEILKRNENCYDLVTVAACLGDTFDLYVLARALGQPMISVADRLERLSKEGGMIRAVDGEDDLYTFRNRSTWAAARKILGLDQPPELLSSRVRVYYQQAAESLEQEESTGPEHGGKLFFLFERAGMRQAGKATKYALTAAQMLTATNQYDAAKEVLDRALRSARLCGTKRDEMEQLVTAERNRTQLDELFTTSRDPQKQASEAIKIELRWRDRGGLPVPLIYPVLRGLYNGRDHLQSRAVFAKMVSTEGATLTDCPWLQAEVLHYQALFLLSAEHYSDEDKTIARSMFDKALDLISGSDDIENLAARSRVLTSLAIQFGETEDVKSALEEAISLKERFNDRPGLARSMGALARSLYFKGEVKQALPEIVRWLTLNKELGDRFGEAMAENFQGSAYVALYKKTPDDENLYKEALAAFARAVSLATPEANMGIKIQAALALAERMQLMQYRKDESGYRQTAAEQAQLLSNMERIGSPFYREKLRKATSWAVTADDPAIEKIHELLQKMEAS